MKLEDKLEAPSDGVYLEDFPRGGGDEHPPRPNTPSGISTAAASATADAFAAVAIAIAAAVAVTIGIAIGAATAGAGTGGSVDCEVEEHLFLVVLGEGGEVAWKCK